jgi:hypothetical protein
MNLDLIHRWYDFALLNEASQVRDLKVGHSDGACPSVAVELLKRVPGRNEVTAVQGRQRPVDQEEVNMVRAQCLESAVEGSTRIVRPVVPVVELAGDENFAAIQARSPNGLPHILFIAVHLGGIDVPVADPQSLSHSVGCLSRVNLEDSEAKLWNGLAAVQRKIWNCHALSALRCLLERRRVALLCTLISIRCGELIDAVAPHFLSLSVASVACGG